jgi:hypothetical protein
MATRSGRREPQCPLAVTRNMRARDHRRQVRQLVNPDTPSAPAVRSAMNAVTTMINGSMKGLPSTNVVSVNIGIDVDFVNIPTG